MSHSQEEKLADAFAKREKWTNNRASAIFPIFLSDTSDTHLVFQNYWHWKSNIEEVFCILRIRDFDGKNISSPRVNIQNHNEIYLSDFVNRKEFKGGTVEIEIISPENLAFSFPAISAFYISKNQRSAVHSAGRILNTNEVFGDRKWKESNFLAKFEDNFSPYICLFFGQLASKKTQLKIEIRNFKENQSMIIKEIDIDTNPFGSKVIYIKDLLTNAEINRLKNIKAFIIFEVDIVGIFGRFVVGNFDKISGHHFTTHSFQCIEEKSSDIIKSDSKNECTTFLPIYNQKPLNLSLVSFPTNAEKLVKFNVSKADIDQNLRESRDKAISFKTGGSKASAFEYSLNEDGFIKLEAFQDAPARINVNYNFSLKNSIHPTDLATGFKARVYPPKHNHWGPGILGNDWETFIFIRNLGHNKKSTQEAKCVFETWSKNTSTKNDLIVKAESCNVIKLNQDNFKESEMNYFSWKLNSNVTTLETIWVSFNRKTGAIASDHGF